MKLSKNLLKIIITLVIMAVTLSTSVGYAVLSDELNISGENNAETQSGIFITDAKISANNGADLSQSDVTQNGGCILTFNAALSDSDVNSTLSYSVTFYNSTDDYYVYYKNSNTRTNKDYIKYAISGMTKEKTIIAPKSYLTCTTKYLYSVDPATSNITSSNCIINYSFTKCYDVTYENFSSTTGFQTYANPYADFTVTLDNTTPVAVEVGGTDLAISNFTFSSKKLTVAASHISGNLHVRKRTKKTYTNIIKNGSFENSSLTTGNVSTGWAFNSDGSYWARHASSIGSYAARKEICSYDNQHIKQAVSLTANNVYYFFYYAISEGATQIVNSDINLSGTSVTGTVSVSAVNGSNGGFQRSSKIFTASKTSSAYNVNMAWNKNTIPVRIDGVGVVNLTQIFGAGYEPPKAWCDEWISINNNTTVATYI